MAGFSALAPNISIAVQNLGSAFGSLETLILYGGMLIGFVLFVKGFIEFRHATQAAGGRNELGGSLSYFIAGTMLLYFSNTLSMGTETIFGPNASSISGETLGYTNMNGASPWPGLLNVLLKYTQLIGYIAFIRGWMIIAKSGHQQQQQGGTMGKGITHIIAGILLVNIVSTIQVLANTFGINT